MLVHKMRLDDHMAVLDVNSGAVHLVDDVIYDLLDYYDGTNAGSNADPTSYRRYQYNEDTDGSYLWKDPAIEAHSNLDYSDAYYDAVKGGPASVNADSEGNGLIFRD